MPDHAHSLWEATTEGLNRPALDRDLHVDVAIVGGGITGLTAAYELQRAGLRVAVLEQQRLVHGTTGHTTAHLTQIFDTPLKKLRRHFGDDGATGVWNAGRAAIDYIEATARREGIDCDFERVPAYYFAARARDRADVEQEARLARELGFVADVVNDMPYPCAHHGAMRVAMQGQFHPRRYLLPLAERVLARGGLIFEHTHVTNIHTGEPLRLEANGFVVTAEHVVLATHQPLLDQLLVTKVISYQSYAVAARVEKGSFPQALAWDTHDPYYYWRQQPEADHDLVIVGGEDHRTGATRDAKQHLERLEQYVSEALGKRPHAITHRWSHQWLDPVDGVPFIGRTHASPRIYVGTGYAGNGITMGTYAGLLISDLIVKGEHPLAPLFDPGRIKVRAGAVSFLRENLSYPEHLLLDRLRVEREPAVSALAPGEGAVVDVAGRHVACCRTEDGTLHAVDAVCTHMGCLVRWNDAATTWDCPCHGSRFAPDGQVVTGPAMKALEPVEAPRAQKQR